MERLLSYQNAGLSPPPVIFGLHPNGPSDLLDEPMNLSLADKAKMGMYFGPNDAESEHLQLQLRMALEKIHTNAGHSQPISSAEPAEHKPLDGMDPVSSAMLVELAAAVMPEKPFAMGSGSRYTPAQRKIAIKRWLEKRARRHLTSKTKYLKMKDVAVKKSRCVGGKFVKKSDLARMEQERAAAEAAMLVVEKYNDPAMLALSVKEEAVGLPVADDMAFANSGKPASDAAWNAMYSMYARAEE